MVVKLKPTWKIPTKPARDATGVDRGGRGYGEAENPFESDRADFWGTRSRSDDQAIYGPQAIGRPDPNVMNPTPPKGDRRR
jgi:hypothetical protein